MRIQLLVSPLPDYHTYHNPRYDWYVCGVLPRWGVTQQLSHRAHATGGKKVPLVRHDVSDMNVLTRYHLLLSRVLAYHGSIHPVREIYCSDRLESRYDDTEHQLQNSHGYRAEHSCVRVRVSGGEMRHCRLRYMSLPDRIYYAHIWQLLHQSVHPHRDEKIVHSLHPLHQYIHNEAVHQMRHVIPKLKPLIYRGWLYQLWYGVLMYWVVRFAYLAV